MKPACSNPVAAHAVNDGFCAMIHGFGAVHNGAAILVVVNVLHRGNAVTERFSAVAGVIGALSQREFHFIGDGANNAVCYGNISGASGSRHIIKRVVFAGFGQHKRRPLIFNQWVLNLGSNEHNRNAEMLCQNPQVQVRHVADH